MTPCVWIFLVKSSELVCIAHTVGHTSTATQLGVVKHRVQQWGLASLGTKRPFGDDVSVMYVHNRQAK